MRFYRPGDSTEAHEGHQQTSRSLFHFPALFSDLFFIHSLFHLSILFTFFRAFINLAPD